VKITGLYPRVRVDTSPTAAIEQAGGVLLIRTVTVTGLDRGSVLPCSRLMLRGQFALRLHGRFMPD